MKVRESSPSPSSPLEVWDDTEYRVGGWVGGGDLFFFHSFLPSSSSLLLSPREEWKVLDFLLPFPTDFWLAIPGLKQKRGEELSWEERFREKEYVICMHLLLLLLCGGGRKFQRNGGHWVQWNLDIRYNNIVGQQKKSLVLLKRRDSAKVYFSKQTNIAINGDLSVISRFATSRFHCIQV